MRIARFKHGGRTRFGAIEGDEIELLKGAPLTPAARFVERGG
jgi:hypothetical protein